MIISSFDKLLQEVKYLTEKKITWSLCFIFQCVHGKISK